MIIKYIDPHQLFGDKYAVRLNNGTSEEIAKSAKVFEAYDVAQRYDELINDYKILLEEHASTETAANFIKQAEIDLQQSADDINSFIEKTKSGVQEEIRRIKSIDALKEYNKWLNEVARAQKEAETNDILDEDGIVYFDNQPFFRESDLVKYEKEKEKEEKDKEKDDTMMHETLDDIVKNEELDSKKGWKKWEKDENSIVNHPKHYQNYGGLETIDEMILLFGLEETMIFCKLNAWKYRARASKKGSEQEDLDKANWYILKYQELKKRKLEYDLYDNAS